MSSKKKITIHVITPFFALGAVLVVLKLMNVLSLSWWTVTAPFWGPYVIAVGLILAWFAALAGTAAAVAAVSAVSWVVNWFRTF